MVINFVIDGDEGERIGSRGAGGVGGGGGRSRAVIFSF